MSQSGRFDVHAHYLVPGEELPGVAGQFYASSPIPRWSPEGALQFMNQNGIAVQMLSVATVAAPDEVRKANEYGASVVRSYPDRFGLLAAVPMGEPEAALAEINHAFEKLSADGVILLTNYEGKYLGDPGFERAFAELNRRKASVLLHPTSPVCYQCVASGRPAPLIEFPFDTCRTVTDMLFSGTFEKYPDIRFILSHAGGALAVLAPRIASLGTSSFVPHPPEMTEEKVREVFSKLYFDTAIAGTDASLAPVVALTTADHIVFGTDFPPATVPVIKKNIEAIDRLACMTKQDREDISHNGRALFRRFSEKQG
jgi:predicted TIM-barrel fold metal-dependent hydrolase